jgi:hypothetical protein
MAALSITPRGSKVAKAARPCYRVPTINPLSMRGMSSMPKHSLLLLLVFSMASTACTTRGTRPPAPITGQVTASTTDTITVRAQDGSEARLFLRKTPPTHRPLAAGTPIRLTTFMRGDDECVLRYISPCGGPEGEGCACSDREYGYDCGDDEWLYVCESDPACVTPDCPGDEEQGRE